MQAQSDGQQLVARAADQQRAAWIESRGEEQEGRRSGFSVPGRFLKFISSKNYTSLPCHSDLRKNFSPLGIFNFSKQNIQSIKKKQIPHSMTAEN